MSYSDTIGKINTTEIEELDPEEIILRIAVMATMLEVYEGFVSYLGVGTVLVKRLPNAFRIEVDFNDSDTMNIGYFVDPSQLAFIASLRVYLLPSLED